MSEFARERGKAMRWGVLKMRRALAVIGVVGLSLWAVSLVASWSNLAVVSFGPAEIASIAKRDLFLRYGAGLLVAGSLWLWSWFVAVKRDGSRNHPPRFGRGERSNRTSRRGAAHSG